MLSPRVAPQMIGLGLLEAVPEADILALADPEDADGDGISGRPNIVWSEATGAPMLGRFGGRRGSRRSASSRRRRFPGTSASRRRCIPDGWGECTEAEADCRAAPDGGAPEADDTVLDLVTFYSRNLAVPARRDLGRPAGAARQARCSTTAGCAACHTPKFVTDAAGGPAGAELPADLALQRPAAARHGRGAGRPSARGAGDGTEWRTAPLWGIGLTETVTGQASFLHDGRARTLLEAVLWHGGEAQAARDRVVAHAEGGARRAGPVPGVALMRHRCSLPRCSSSPLPAAAETDHAAIAERALHQHILPGFERLAAAAGALAAAAEAACAGSGPIDAGPVEAAYAEAFDAWARDRGTSASGRPRRTTPASRSSSGPTPRARPRGRSRR